MDELFVFEPAPFPVRAHRRAHPHTVSPSHKRPNAAYIAILGAHASTTLDAPAAIRSA